MTDQESDDEAFLNAFDRREQDRIESLLRARSPQRTVYAMERQRVAGLLARDRAYRDAEYVRESALIEVSEGKTVSIRDAADAPTPEQIALADRHGAGFRRFVPRLENGTVATVKAYRRRDVPQAHKMLLGGVIDYGGLKACSWYRQLYEATGLSGHYQSTNYVKEIFESPVGHTMFTEHQIDDQQIWYAVRSHIRRRHLALLDLMVIEDIPIHRAVRAARGFHRRAKAAFGEAVEQLVSAREKIVAVDDVGKL